MLTRIANPELFFGFVAPIGVDIGPSIDLFAQALSHLRYQVKIIKVTDSFHEIKELPNKLIQNPLANRYKSYIQFGNAARKKFKRDEILAALTIGRIFKARELHSDGTPVAKEKVAYLIHQFKRKEEIDLFRSVYGRLFFQVSIYSSRRMRIESLSKKFADDARDSDFDKYRSAAESLIRIDENELEVRNGQRLRQVFHLADFIINKDAPEDEKDQIDRFMQILFGNNSESPTKAEYGMYIAKSASLRSLDLSRQVGAAVFSERGEVISLGCNEVPRGGGGTYWSDDKHDNRDFKRKEDPNEKIKRQNVIELLHRLREAGYIKSKPSHNTEDHLFWDPSVQESKIMDSLEYGRIIHAEMSAISDAARLGRATIDAIMYCTTFPCHICAKHIVASGVSKVVFLEPYPKSHAFDLHYDSIRVEGDGSAEYEHYPKTEFIHFYGISPRRYRDFFEKGKRKSKDEQFVEWSSGAPRPIVDMKLPIWCLLEENIFSDLPASLKSSCVRLRKYKLDWTPVSKDVHTDRSSRGHSLTHENQNRAKSPRPIKRRSTALSRGKR